MGKKLLLLVIGMLVGIGGFLLFLRTRPVPVKIVISPTPRPTPLSAYSFENLAKVSFSPQPIQIEEPITSEESIQTAHFSFAMPSYPGKTEMKRVSGFMHVPTQPGTYPVLILLRGFVSKESYAPGVGTKRVAERFAKNGFITLAPDFLGYGSSDQPSENSFEARFQTYSTTLSLLSSLSTLQSAVEASFSGVIADTSKVGIWGHSNGGHIALATLSITKKAYPTVLWNPVSKSFPYSILSYADEYDDQGKLLRASLSLFERDYDTDAFSPPKFFDRINAPILLHQGEADEEVPFWWSDELHAKLKKLDKDISYTLYPGADHNLMPNGWSPAVQAAIEFYTMQFNTASL